MLAVEKDEATDSNMVVVPSTSQGEVQTLEALTNDKAVRRLLRKLDFIVLPTLTIMYIFK